MTKIFVLDTNVILHDAECIFKFQENQIIIPQPVLEEIDTKKRLQDEVGRNARAFSRYIDELRSKGDLVVGVPVNDQGGTLVIKVFAEVTGKYLPYQDMLKKDNQILAIAIQTYASNDREAILVSNDTNMRINADIFGMPAESYKNDRINPSDTYTGLRHIDVPDEIIEQLYETKTYTSEFACLSHAPAFPNECFILHSLNNPKKTAMVRYHSNKQVYKLLQSSMKVCDITPRNSEQQFLLDMLTDTNISLVSVNGKAGSGKTLMSLAAAIHQVMEKKLYNKILLLKPIVSMDNAHDLGFLPGSMEEKLAPWMASYSDNIEVIMSGYKDKKDKNDDDEEKEMKIGKRGKIQKLASSIDEKQIGKTSPMQELIHFGYLEVGSLQHVRGRSLPKQFIILDEAQNISKHALKTMVTRLGEGSKIIIMGDETQIDSPYLDSSSNALSIVAEAMKDQDIAGHITLRKSERSKLAEIASEVL